MRKQTNFRVAVERRLGIDWEHSPPDSDNLPLSLQTNQLFDNCTELLTSPLSEAPKQFV